VPIVVIKPPTRPVRHAAGVFAYLDQAAQLGADIDFPEVKRARKLYGRVEQIQTDAAMVRAGAFDSATIAKLYADGKASVEDVLDAAARAATSTKTTAAKVLADAERIAERAVMTELAKPGDRYIEALRPVLAPIVETIDDLAAKIPTDCYDAIAVKSHGVKVAWAQLDQAVAQWDEVHHIADSLRISGLVPVRRERYGEDYRWGRPDRLDGTNRGTLRNHFILQGFRNGAQPGIYTDAEVEQAYAQAEAA
jgi:hypothetical protein